VSKYVIRYDFKFVDEGLMKMPFCEQDVFNNHTISVQISPKLQTQYAAIFAAISKKHEASSAPLLLPYTVLVGT